MAQPRHGDAVAPHLCAGLSGDGRLPEVADLLAVIDLVDLARRRGVRSLGGRLYFLVQVHVPSNLMYLSEAATFMMPWPCTLSLAMIELRSPSRLFSRS